MRHHIKDLTTKTVGLPTLAGYWFKQRMFDQVTLFVVIAIYQGRVLMLVHTWREEKVRQEVEIASCRERRVTVMNSQWNRMCR